MRQMVVVTGSNINSETWNIVHTLVSGNVVDPILATRTGEKKFILGAFPDLEKSRPIFPIIIIDNPTVDRGPQTFSYGNISNIVNVSVAAYSKSNKQVNEISDDIQDAILQSRQSMLGSNISLLSVNTGATGTDIVANDRVHFKETQAQFRLLSTSA